jgi:hypothetical protein
MAAHIVLNLSVALAVVLFFGAEHLGRSPRRRVRDEPEQLHEPAA